MKMKFTYALVLAGALCAFPSCKENEPKKPNGGNSGTDEPGVEEVIPGSALQEKAYSAENLTITLDGNAVVGKVVTYTPAENGTATITLSGEPLNVMELMAAMSKADGDIVLPTAGVLPGSPSVTIPVTLTGEGGNCSFSGASETEYCSYSYSGSVNADAFSIELTNVQLKDKSMIGTWYTKDFLRDPQDPSSGYFYNVAHVVWDAEALSSIDMGFGFPIPMPIGDVLKFALGMNVLDPNKTGTPDTALLKMISDMLESVTFEDNGNVTAKYVDVKTGEVSTAAAGIAQYVVGSNNTIRLFLNPAAIIANTVKNTDAKSRETDIAALLDDVVNKFGPLLSEGITVHYGPAVVAEDGTTSDKYTSEDGNPYEGLTSFYLDTETLLPILQTIAPLISDDEIVSSLMAQLASDPSMAAMSGALEGILKSLPEVIATTSKVEIGLNLQRK